MEQQIHFCTTPTTGVQIAYGTVGQGPPLVKPRTGLAPEFDWQSPIWRNLLRDSRAIKRSFAMNERGNGLSDWNVADLSFTAWVEDLESVVNAAKVDRFPLLGIPGRRRGDRLRRQASGKVSHLILYGAYARGWITRDSADESNSGKRN